MKRGWKIVILFAVVLVALSAGADQFVTSMKIYLQLNPPNHEKAILQGEEGLKDKGSAKNWELHALLAECYASVGRFPEAGKQYQEAMALNPGKKDVIAKGDGKYIEGWTKRWERSFYKGADFRVKSSFPVIPLSSLALTDSMKSAIKQLGQPEEVRKGVYLRSPWVVFTYWTKGLDLKFIGADTMVTTPIRDLKIKDYRELALKELRVAIALDPGRAQAYEQMAALYDKPGQRDTMIAMIQEAIKADPKKAALHSSLGTVYEKDGKFAEAVQEFKQAVALDSLLFRAWAGMGECYQSLQKYPEAVEAFQRALTLDPNASDVYFNLGLAYFNKEDYANSLKAFKRVVASSPADGDAWAFVGHSSLNLKEEKAAVEAYEKAVDPACSLSPEYAYAVWLDLCKLYTRQNKTDKAKAACAKAQELAPKK